MSPVKDETSHQLKLGWTRRLHSSLAQDVAKMKDQLMRAEKKMKFLQGKALLHQVQLLSETEDLDFRTLGPKSGMVILRKEHSDEMQTRLTAQKSVSLVALSKVQVEVDRVIGMDEGLEDRGESQSPVTGSSISNDESGVEKAYKLEGKVKDFAFTVSFSANDDMEKFGADINEVTDLRLDTVEGVVKKIMDPGRVLLPRTVQQFTSDLYYFQMLSEKRKETSSSLEADIPNLIIDHTAEPMEFKFLPTRDFEVRVLWAIVWDSKNNRLKDDIAIECDDEVVVRFSSSEEVYPFLSGREQLRTAKELTRFIEAFSNL